MKRCLLVVVSSIIFYPLSAQKILRFKNESAQKIIELVGEETSYKFNYLDRIFKSDKYTFSITKDENLPLELATAFGLEISKLDSLSYALVEGSVTQPEYAFKVLSGFDRQSIIGATLWIPALEVGIVSNESGIFKWVGVLSGDEKIQISYLGFETVVLSARQARNISELVLHEREHILSDIVITDFIRQDGSQKYKLNPNDESSASTPDKDVLEIAQSTPGVYNSGESLNDLQIRGGPPDQVSYNWNGIRLFQNSLFYGRISAANPFMVDEIRISRNGATADQTAEASGAINMFSKLTVDTTQIKVHINMLYANASVSSSFLKDRLKVKLAYRRSVNDLFESQSFKNYYSNSFQFGRIQDITYYLDSFGIRPFTTLIPSFGFQDLSFSGQWDLGKHSFIKANYIRFGNQFDYRVENDFDDSYSVDDFQIGTLGSSIQWNQKWSDQWSSKTEASYSSYRYRYFLTEDGDDLSAPFRNQENDVELNRIKSSLRFLDKTYSLEIGYEYHEWDVEYRDTTTIEEDLWSIRKNQQVIAEHGAFLLASLYSKSWYYLEAGIRRSQLGRVIWEPRVNLSFFPNRYWTIHLHYGAFHQSLNRRNILTRLNAENGFWLLSDERAETSDFIPIVQQNQWSAGVLYKRSKLEFSLDAYFKEGKNIWSSAYDFTAEEDPFEFLNTETKGVEVGISYTSINLFANWTYDHVVEKLNTLSSEQTTRSPFSQPHRFAFIQGLKIGNFRFDTNLRYSSGRLFSVPSALVQLDVPDQGFVNELKFDDLLNFQVKDYVRLDAALSFRQVLEKGRSKYMIAKFQILNLFDRPNIIKNEYFVDYRSEPPITNLFQRKGLPLTYNISLEFHL